MNIELKKKLQSLELSDLALAIEEQENNTAYLDMPFNERIEILAEEIYQKRYNDLVKKLIRLAAFKYPTSSIESLDFELRKIDKQTIINLSQLGFINLATNLIITGVTGTGKTYLSNAIGIEACKKGIRTYYVRVPNLIKKIEELSSNPKESKRFMHKLANYGLLILDEWLIYKPNDREIKFFYELFEMRAGVNSTIFISQYSKVEWHERLGGGTHADSIMDRIVHNSYVVPSTETNMRKHYDQEKKNIFLETLKK